MAKSKPFRFDDEEPVSPGKGRKTEGSPARAASASAAASDPQPTRVIAKVRTPHYVPPGFVVRTRIDETLFTADAPAEAVEKANSDPQVESISRAQGLRPS